MCALIMELYKDNLELLNISHFHLFLKFDIDHLITKQNDLQTIDISVNFVTGGRYLRSFVEYCCTYICYVEILFYNHTHRKTK